MIKKRKELRFSHYVTSYQSFSYFHINAQKIDSVWSFSSLIKTVIALTRVDAPPHVNRCISPMIYKVCLPRANKRRFLCWLQSERSALKTPQQGCSSVHHLPFLMVIRQVNLPVIAGYCRLLVCLFFSQDGSVPL